MSGQKKLLKAVKNNRVVAMPSKKVERPILDREGNQILDSEGNPIYKRKTTLCVQLTGVLTALFEIDADKVVKAPADAPDYGVYD